MRYILIALLFVGCNWKNPLTLKMNGVTQEFRHSDYYSSGSCNNPNGCVETYAWIDGRVVKSFYDNPETITDSILNLRRKQAQEFIDKIKKYDR